MNKTINDGVNCTPVTSRDYAFGVKELPTVMVTWLHGYSYTPPKNQ